MLTCLRSLVFAVAITAAPCSAFGQEMRVTLLGTGCPSAVINRFGPSTLVEAGEQKFLFDVGRGSLQRLTQIRVRWQDVRGVFLTHLHSDHVVGFPDAWLTGSLVPPGRSTPLNVWGPNGTTSMMTHLRQAYDFDIRVRMEESGRPAAEGTMLLAQDVAGGVAYERDGVRITAFEVDHGLVRPALGYRIDYRGRSVVLSGDTRISENLIRHAAGVDLLVHEVFVPETLYRVGVPPPRAKNIIDLHVTPEQAGEVFSRTKPKLAVYSHICMPDATDDEIVSSTRKTYTGPLAVGEDLMVIEVADKIDVRTPAREDR